MNLERFKKFLSSKWVPYTAIALVIFIIYVPTLFYGVVYLDDTVLVLRDYEFNQSFNVVQAFKEDIYRKPFTERVFYRPILRLSFMWDAQLGENMVLFMSRLTNIALHILAVCFLFVFLLKMKIRRDLALFWSLLVAIHPIAVSGVALIASRNDTLLATIILLAMSQFIDFVNTQKIEFLIWHIVFVFLALCTKETAVVLPAVALIYLILFEDIKSIHINSKKYMLLGVLWIMVGFIWLKMRSLALGHSIASGEFKIFNSIYENFSAIVPNIGKIFLPFDLSTFPVLEDMSFLYGLTAISLLGIWFVVAKNKNHRLIVFGLIWFFAFMLLALIKKEGGIVEFSEHRIYLPMLGFIFVLQGLGQIEKIKKLFCIFWLGLWVWYFYI